MVKKVVKDSDGNNIDLTAKLFGEIADQYKDRVGGYTQIIKKGSGWHKADMYFNSGDAEAVNFVMRYYATDGYVGCYLDNISLVECYHNLNISYI